MAHVIEPAVSGRSRCRGCGATIARGSDRFGERLPNPYSDAGDLTIWYHPKCAAYRRPEAFLATLGGTPGVVGGGADLEAVARRSLEHHRMSRIGGLERASSGRARCRHCRSLIGRGALRIPLLFYEEGLFTASGFVHVQCAEAYVGCAELLDCVRHFSPALPAEDVREAQAWLR